MGLQVWRLFDFTEEEIMKRIHCFISSLEGGGAEHQMSYLCNFLAEAGYDVTLVTLLPKPDRYKVLPSIKRICLDYDLSSTKWVKLYKKLYIFFYFLFIRTDGIISYLVGSNSQVLLPMMLRPWTKVIVSERNLITWKLSRYEKFVYGGVYRRANFIVSNSHAMTRYFSEHFPQLRNKLRTITNYTDLEKYSVTPLPLGEKLQIGIFARYQKQKNYERFAEMLSIVKQEPHRAFMVHWYGDLTARDAQNDVQHFREQIRKLEIEDVITLHDFAMDVPSVMKSIDIICLPSVYEGFSNSLAEAICCGKPVIAGNVSDNSAMVIDGENGFLFNSCDSYNMADVFVKMVNATNDNLLNMSRKSKVIADNLFFRDSFIQGYSQLIEI